MNTDNIRNQLSAALSSASKADFTATATDLLAVLGYRSERTLELSGGVDDFFQAFPAATDNTNTELIFRKQVNSVRIIFQVTSEEIAGSDQSMLEFAHANPFDEERQQSFIFFAVELTEPSYARGDYATFTREINKRLNQPSVVLFKTADNLLTFAFVHRRKHNRDPSRDVLGQVSLIREIHPAAPHRAHLDILSELSLAKCIDSINTHNKTPNFDSLLAAWLDKLDTEQLNRRFYRELFDWFNRAVAEARFPSDEARTLSAEEHVIRLITRLLFIWFIKEKGLIASELFIEAKIVGLLKNYCQETGDSYYRSVLQNLFFATLNTEIDKRGFSKAQNTTHRNFSLYRYKHEMGDPDALLTLFGKTPFINGGLFDCLDSEESTTHGGWRIDCFSDVHYKKLSIPDRLFFDNDGLFPLLNRYRFTVEENTPVEQEVALDPELLGKVFENLLAAYNPETKDTVRKQTGSYYTPREVVDYMVNEALVATLAERAHPNDDDMEFWRERLHYLLDYADAFNDADELFEESEKKGIVQAIAAIKILDPAVGSGAFPMGVLHKLTLALQRLDPKNQLWEKLQKERAKTKADMAFENRDQQERDAELLEISETFERYSGNFGRKLYLIQNSIFGVDIQPVACQIAKLRFFISLAIEQEPDANVDNFGIKPLPNLETRFVAANTLIATKEKPRQDDWIFNQIEILKTKLSGNREKHFHATTRQKKLDCWREDKKLRKELSEALHSAGLSEDDARKIAEWDPYDQNASAEWFDAGYMFGIADGFDVVIGNPPYVESRNNLLTGEIKDAYRRQVKLDWNETLPLGSDLLIYFLARASKLLSESGNGCLITQNAWLSTNYGKNFQDFSLGKFSFQRIVDTSAKFFSDSSGPQINAVIAIFDKSLRDNIAYEVVNDRMETESTRTITARQAMKWGHAAYMPQFFIDMLSEIAKRADSGINITFGQGLNFPPQELNQPNSREPVIFKDVRFVAVAANGKIRSEHITANRRGKVPALIMPRGIGDRYYCTFNVCKAFSYSGVELYLADDLWGSGLHYCLWAYLNSSFVWLFRELTGRKNLGGGLLKAEATDMNMLPIDFEFDFAEQAKAVFSKLKHRCPLPLAREIRTEEHLTIDKMVFDYFGYEGILENVRAELLAQVTSRTRHSR